MMTPRPPRSGEAQQARVWVLLILGGILSAVHIWKLAGALPELLVSFQMTLVSAGVLFAIIQAASIIGGLPVAWSAGSFGVKRLACVGLFLLGGASAAGALVDSYGALVLLRGIEGIGFVIFAVLAPPLIAAHAAPRQRDFAVGAWAMFQGVAAFLGLALTPIVLAAVSWRVWWLVLAVATLVLAVVLTCVVPDDRARVASPERADAAAPTSTGVARTRWGLASVWASVRSPETWLAGIVFACYSGPWLAVLGFLPTVFESGSSVATAYVGLLAGGVGLANAAGAFIGARLMQAGLGFGALLIGCFIGIAVSISCAFWVTFDGVGAVVWMASWLAVFSALGGLVAAVITRIGVAVTPAASSPPVTFGLMQQIFNVGNLAGPPLLALIVGAVGGWQGSAYLVLAAAALGICSAIALERFRRSRSDPCPRNAVTSPVR